MSAQKKQRNRKKNQAGREALLLLVVMLLGCAIILGSCVVQGAAGDLEQSLPSETDGGQELSSQPAPSSEEPTQEPTSEPTETTQEPASEPTESTEAPTTPPTESKATSPTTGTTPLETPEIPREELLVLVNPTHKIPENWTVNLVQLVNGQAVDRRAYPSLQRMMDDCRAAGLRPVIVSSYRTHDYQANLFKNRVQRWKNEHPGWTSEEEAEAGAAFWVARPDTSEHQLGFAVDIVDNANWNLDESQEKMPAQQWLMQNSWRYGWILRYPTDKSEITKIGYEPWHYRFVGEEAAREMYEAGLCLEEYLNILD